MKKIWKGFALFLLFLALYFIPALLFPAKPEYYQSLNQPFYAPPAAVFGIIWPILYGIFSIILAEKLVNRSLTKEQTLYFIANYGISFFFNKVFFIDHSLFLSFVVTFSSLITGILIWISLGKNNKAEALALLPYLIWTLYASVLMAHIYFIN